MSTSDMLVVASKVRAYMKENGMSTASAAMSVLSDQVKKICDQAMEKARSDGRKTVLERDFG